MTSPPSVPAVLATVESALKHKNINGANAIFHHEVPRALSHEIILNLPGGAKKMPEYVVHYTTMEAMASMLDRCMQPQYRSAEALRMYDAATFKDPQEGVLPGFADCIPTTMERCLGKFSQGILNDLPKGAPWSSAYILSFSAQKSSKKMGDNLEMWLLHGNRGRGCSLQIRHESLVSKKSLPYPICPFVSVRYSNPSNRTIIQTFKRAFTPVVNFLHRHGDESYVKATGGFVQSLLALAGCLYKDKQYKYENEFRLVRVIPENNHKEVEFDTTNPSYIRRYVKGPYLVHCLDSHSALTTGPMVHPVTTQALDKMRIKAEVIKTVRPSGIIYGRP